MIAVKILSIKNTRTHLTILGGPSSQRLKASFLRYFLVYNLNLMGVVDFVKSDSVNPAAKYLADTITKHLKAGEKVTWLVTGGSAIEVALGTTKKLAGVDLSKLSVTLTDERFLPTNHKDSNWKQLIGIVDDLPNAQLYPVLYNVDIAETTARFGTILRKFLNESDYTIGLFGMGLDGHIAALFPGLPQLEEQNVYAASLDNSPKPPPQRMTMTVPAIKKLDEAVLYAIGKEKKAMIENLAQDLPTSEQPAQILKSLPKLTIFNDQIGEKI